MARIVLITVLAAASVFGAVTGAQAHGFASGHGIGVIRGHSGFGAHSGFRSHSGFHSHSGFRSGIAFGHGFGHSFHHGFGHSRSVIIIDTGSHFHRPFLLHERPIIVVPDHSRFGHFRDDHMDRGPRVLFGGWRH